MRSTPWLTLALAGSLAGLGVIGANAGADLGEPRMAEVTVLSKRTLMSAPVSPAVGSGFVSGGDLYDEQGRAKIGEGYSHCGVVSVTLGVPPAVTANCTSVFRLPGGELHLSGMRDYTSITDGFDDAPLAVVGGTGEYANVRGAGQATRATADDGTVGYRFAFSVLTE